MKKVRFVGLDVHADTIAVAVAEPGGTVRSVGVIPNRPESIRKLVKQLGSPEPRARLLRGGPDRVCHLLAADRTGRAVRGGRTHLGAGEGRRSREDGSARCSEAGAELPRRRLDAGVGSPTPRMRHCGMWCAPARRRRKISCARAIAWGSFCCGTAGAPPPASTAGPSGISLWVKGVRFAPKRRKRRRSWTISMRSNTWPHRLTRLEAALDEAVQAAPAPMRAVIAALQALRGVAQVSAATIVAELGQVSRFGRPSATDELQRHGGQRAFQRCPDRTAAALPRPGMHTCGAS